MKCQLQQVTRFNSADELNFETIESYVKSDHFDLYLCRCKECGQLYIGSYVEVCLSDGEDDSWNYWVPVSEEDVGKIRKNHRAAIKMINDRRHIAWHPNGTIFWRTMQEMPFMYVC